MQFQSHLSVDNISVWFIVSPNVHSLNLQHILAGGLLCQAFSGIVPTMHNKDFCFYKGYIVLNFSQTFMCVYKPARTFIKNKDSRTRPPEFLTW